MSQTPLQGSVITNDSIVIEEEEAILEKKKGLMDRYFGPMGSGSLRAGIFTLLASAMGTGIFNLPLRVKEIGVFPFIIFVSLGAFFSMIGMVMMIRLIRKKKFDSYSDMAEASLGKPFMRLAQACLIIYPWGITICFQVILARFVCQLLNDQLHVKLYEDKDDQTLTKSGNHVRILVNIVAMTLMLVFALKKKIDILQKVAIIGVVSVIFNVICIVITSFTGFSRPDDVYHHYHGIFHADFSKVNWWSHEGAESLSLFAQGLASILFCYVNHQLLFPLSTSLKRPSKKRFSKIVNRSHIVLFLSYLLIGTLGYLLLVEHEDRHPISSMVIASIPIPPLLVGKGLMIIALFFSVPLNLFPARESIFQATKFQKTTRNHVIITLCLLFSSCLIAILFQAVNSYFGLLGGTAGVMMAAGIPAICYAKLTPKLSKSDIASLIIVGLVSVICIIGAVLSVVDPPNDK